METQRKPNTWTQTDLKGLELGSRKFQLFFLSLSRQVVSLNSASLWHQLSSLIRTQPHTEGSALHGSQVSIYYTDTSVSSFTGTVIYLGSCVFLWSNQQWLGMGYDAHVENNSRVWVWTDYTRREVGMATDCHPRCNNISGVSETCHAWFPLPHLPQLLLFPIPEKGRIKDRPKTRFEISLNKL